jgi:hypothetical protein
MTKELEPIREALLAEYETAGRIDSRRWLNQYPQFAAELLEFIMWLDSSPRIADVKHQRWFDEEAIAMNALQAACAQFVRKDRHDTDRTLGEELFAVRKAIRKPQSQGSANPHFRRAAVLAWAVR